MRFLTVLRTVPPIAAMIVAVPCLLAQAPAVPREAQGLPPRVAPVDYFAQGKAGTITIAAEFTGHGIPTLEGPLYSEEYVAVEVGFYGPPEARLTIALEDFSLRINGRKTPLASVPYGLVAKGIRDPEWGPVEPAGPKSKGSIGGPGAGQQEPGAPPPIPPKPPIELLRGWQQRIQQAAIAKGDRALPQAGLFFFQYRGKQEGIRTVELIYEGPAGSATLALQQ